MSHGLRPPAATDVPRAPASAGGLSRRALWDWLGAGSLVSLLVCYAVASQSLVLGSSDGGWVYGYVAVFNPRMLMVAAAATALAAVLVFFSPRSDWPAVLALDRARARPAGSHSIAESVQFRALVRERRGQRVLRRHRALPGRRGASRLRSRPRVVAVARAKQHARQADAGLRPPESLAAAGSPRMARGARLEFRRGAHVLVCPRAVRGPPDRDVLGGALPAGAGEAVLLPALELGDAGRRARLRRAGAQMAAHGKHRLRRRARRRAVRPRVLRTAAARDGTALCAACRCAHGGSVRSRRAGC